MKKVGILTLYYKTYNYGAQLQAYALQNVIQKIGYDCEQIAFKWSKAHTEYMYENLLGNSNKFREFSLNIPHSQKIYSPEDIHECSNKYDIFVCGSDQLWGVNESMPIYVLPQITLSFVPNHKIKIGYGISMGGVEVEERIKSALHHAVSELDAVSVREQNAVPFVNSMTDKKVHSVIDPTMLLDREEWKKIATNPAQKDEYVFVYNIGKNLLIDKAAKALSEQLNCGIKTLSYDAKDSAGPKEFLGFIKNAKLILTNSFHGTIFSILFHKEFLSFEHDQVYSEFSKNYRITDLLYSLGLESRFISNNAKYDLTGRIDYDIIDIRLQKRRRQSLDFLKESLNLEKQSDHAMPVPKSNCYGCGACTLVCPNNCISVKEDCFGFSYPAIEMKKCTNCNLCKEVCPVGKSAPSNRDREIVPYYAINKDLDIRFTSSSGGVFTAFAQYVINQGGVVFGAAYDNDFSVIHSSATKQEDLGKFRGSKYVQSDIKDTYCETELFLKQGILVLYSGCPCQINGLKSYLGKEYHNLFTIDLICGGVTSPALWKKYLSYKQSISEIGSVNMRSKSGGFLHASGFPCFSMKLIHIDGKAEITSKANDPFLYSRFSFYRENCFRCDIKNKRHKSDVTIGDFVGINLITPELDDGKGASLIMIRTPKGEDFFQLISQNLKYKKFPLDSVLKSNPMIEKNIRPLAWRDYLLSIFSESSIEKIFYEGKIAESEYLAYLQQRQYFIEIKRNEIYNKLLKYQSYNLFIDDDPQIIGNVIIYGAGKVGKLAAECSIEKVLCFVDRSNQVSSINGLPVYQIDSEELKKAVYQSNKITFLITPIWDFDVISGMIKGLFYENINIVSIEKVVEALWV